MELQSIIGVSLFASTLVLIIWRPFGLPEWVTALGGAVGMIVIGLVPFADVLQVLEDNLNVFGFFLGLMTIAALAEQAGFFDALALGAARWSGQSSRRLMLNVMLVGTLITTFLTNDATALILTPVVFTLVSRLQLNPLPFMFGCTFIADTASFFLPVSNPINVLVLSAFPQTLGQFLAHLLLPALLVTAGNIALFLWIFRKDLRQPFDLGRLEQPASYGRYFWFVVLSLGAIAVAYVVATALSWPISFVALGGSAWLLAGALVTRRLRWSVLGREISWSIFGFIAGMLVVVRGVELLGFTQLFGDWLVALAGTEPLRAAFVAVFGSALAANAINNVPAALMFIGALRASDAGAVSSMLVYGLIVGADLGPNITTIGSLATVLWLLILRRRGLHVSSFAYFRLGIAVTPPLLALGALALWLSFLGFGR